jgi:hypothetical protein
VRTPHHRLQQCNRLQRNSFNQRKGHPIIGKRALRKPAINHSCSTVVGQGVNRSVCPPQPVAYDLFVETAKRSGMPVPRSADAWLKKLTVRITDQGIEGWRAMLSRVDGSRFLRGDNPSGWRLGIDCGAVTAGAMVFPTWGTPLAVAR